ncbi:alpha/beta hydrolase [Bosea sp. (in: a-proteobacteria)]|uniref:alpha/beta fold hydrolase n=1 Tax=Bosea sp. (in: a-proteobacteria) TaxID=1871050 RepID=UPI002DDD69F3|nr:alpha/beta hydrolase [Bosea sp. (in: a-proteobacteria)]HEV2512650.1 alpha/beta hydrolase [Bosea sp. (in: a-proteobacteria)]
MGNSRQVASLAVSLAALLASSVMAVAQVAAKSVVLVHGAFADGSSWHKVIPELERAELKVIAVQNALQSLENDVATTRRAIRDAEGPVVLVGHSYGGIVITEAGNDPKVKSLVYVAAYAPDNGEAQSNIASRYPQLESRAEYIRDEEGFLRISDVGIAKYFAADLPPAEQRLVAAVQGRLHSRALATPVVRAAWRDKPTFMAVAVKDAIIPPQLQKDQVERSRATSIEVPSSHVAMLSFPEKISELIIRAAK